MRISDWSSDVCSSDLDAEDHRQVAGAHAHRRANAVVEGADKKPAADGGDDQAGEQVDAISTEHGQPSCRSYGSRAFPPAGPAGELRGRGPRLGARRIAAATRGGVNRDGRWEKG